MSKKKTTKDRIKSTKTKSTNKAAANKNAPAKDKTKQKVSNVKIEEKRQKQQPPNTAKTPHNSKNDKNVGCTIYPPDTERGANVKVKIKRLSDKNDGHKHIIGDSIDDKYVSIGLTTQTTPGKSKHKNKALQARVLNLNKTSYLRREGRVEKKSKYTNNYIGYVTPDDKIEIDARISKAKQKYLDKK